MSNPRKPRPTKADVDTWLEDRRRNHFGAMHSRMRVADQWLHADEEPSPILPYVRQGFPEHHVWEIYPYAWTVLNRGVNQYYTAEVPQVTVELDPDYKDAHERAAEDEQAMQQALQGILYHIATSSTENPFLDLCNQQLGPGLGCLSYPLDYERWGEAPEHGRGTPEEEEAWQAYERRRADTLPWVVTSLHPTWVFFDPQHGIRPQDFIIERKVSRREMARRYPRLHLESGSSSGQPREDSRDVTYREYVSEDWWGCWVDDQPVTEHPDVDQDGIAPNTLHHLWYQLAFSGLGKQDQDASWERRCVGLIQRGIGTFKALTRDDNFMALIKGSWIPKYVAKNPDREVAEQETEDIDPMAPGVVALSADTTFGPMESPEVPDALIRDIAERKQRLAQLYGPETLSGTYQSEPAAKFAARLEQARGPYRSPKKNAEQAVSSMLLDMLWDLKYEPDLAGFAIAWRDPRGGRRFAGLKPEQVHLNCKITVDFSPLTPEEKAFAVADAREKQEAGWWSQETAMKKAGEVDDPDEELAEIAAEAVIKSEVYLGFLAEVTIGALRQQLGLPPPVMGPTVHSGAEVAPAPAQPAAPLPPNVPQGPEPLPGSAMGERERMNGAFRAPVVQRAGTGY